MPPFQGNESIHTYFCFVDQNRFLQTVFEYVMFVYVVHVSLPLWLVASVGSTCTMHTNLAAAAALGAHRSFRCFVPRDTWCRMEPQPRLWYSSGRYMPTLGGCVALTWWVAHIMSGNDVPIIRGTRVPLIWFLTKDNNTCIIDDEQRPWGSVG